MLLRRTVLLLLLLGGQVVLMSGEVGGVLGDIRRTHRWVVVRLANRGHSSHDWVGMNWSRGRVGWRHNNTSDRGGCVLGRWNWRGRRRMRVGMGSADWSVREKRRPWCGTWTAASTVTATPTRSCRYFAVGPCRNLRRWQRRGGGRRSHFNVTLKQKEI